MIHDGSDFLDECCTFFVRKSTWSYMFQGNIQYLLDSSDLTLTNTDKVANVRRQKFPFTQNGPLGHRNQFLLIFKVQAPCTDGICSALRAMQSELSSQSSKPPLSQLRDVIRADLTTLDVNTYWPSLSKLLSRAVCLQSQTTF